MHSCASSSPSTIINTTGARVVRQVSDFARFIMDFRKAFMEGMSPQYLPKGWAVDHQVEWQIFISISYCCIICICC